MLLVGSPSRSTGTIEEYWLVQMTATMSSLPTPEAASARTAADFTASQTCRASCSAMPPGWVSVSTEARAVPGVRPVTSTTAAFGPLVPRSMARTWRCRCTGTPSLGRGQHTSTPSTKTRHVASPS